MHGRRGRFVYFRTGAVMRHRTIASVNWMPSWRLAAFVIRSTPLVGFIPAGVVAVLMGIVAGRQPPGAEFRLLPVRLAVVSIVVAVGFVFDDPAKPFSDATANPLRVRRGIRALSGLAVAYGIFTLVVLLASNGMELVAVVNNATAASTDISKRVTASAQLPWGRPALEMTTMIGLSLAVAAAISARGEAKPGRVTSGIFLGAYAMSRVIPDAHKPWAYPIDPRWVTSANWWWAALIVVWMAALILSLDTRAGQPMPQRLGQMASPSERNTDIRRDSRGS